MIAEKLFVVYCLMDSRDSSVRYVGMTADVYERFWQHCRMGESNIEKNMWVMELKMLGILPICKTLQVCKSEREAREAERNWIDAFLEIGQPLFNVEATGRQR